MFFFLTKSLNTSMIYEFLVKQTWINYQLNIKLCDFMKTCSYTGVSHYLNLNIIIPFASLSSVWLWVILETKQRWRIKIIGQH